MDVVRVYDECAGCCVGSKLGHAIKVDKEAEENLVCGRAVFEDAEEICLEGYGWDVAGMESEGSRRGCEGSARCGCEGAPNGVVQGSCGGYGGSKSIVGSGDLSQQRREQSEQLLRRIRIDIQRGGRRRRPDGGRRQRICDGGGGVGRRRTSRAGSGLRGRRGGGQRLDQREHERSLP